ncbi:unnamed protein product [Paramecium pentaurelia]|uniref:WD40-repeat-containing domain n=1 Tax=Paramecium pentaurelia TaxID=43138 RepID=A0A8S1U1T0_9CILI|nr:unnamed protein product [Paramecium pentaurelia]
MKPLMECDQKLSDQFSFIRISDKIVKTINYIKQLSNQRFHKQQEQQCSHQQRNQLPQVSLSDIQDEQLNNQFVDKITFLMQSSIENQVKFNKECLNQQLEMQSAQYQLQNEKEKIKTKKLEEKIKAKDLQLEQKNKEIQSQQKLINELKNQSIKNIKEKKKLEETIRAKDLQLQSQNLQIQQLKQIQTQQPIIQSSSQLILKPFTYNIIHNNSIKQNDWCYAIAINKDCSIVLAGCNSEIKVFEFKQEVLKKTQLLIEHQDDVNTLNFMNKSNHFISGSDDKSIIIWSMNQRNQWICQQKLNGHNNSIYCLVLNNNTEDLIISGSRDKTIKFWKKQNQWLCQQTITDHTNNVLGLSLNQQQNKVISCGDDKQILIIEQSQQDSKWIVIQKIMVETYGYRICFINDNLFTFQPFGIEQMHVYEMNNNNKQYLKTKDILGKGGYDSFLFPQQHIKSKYLLVNKIGKYVNLIRTKDNCEFKAEQYIEYKSSAIYGCMSDDAQYLITWDNGSYEIQIRKYNEI